MFKLFRFPCVPQLGESDCGAACLASIAKYNGYTIPISYIRDCVGTGQQGTTLLGLKRGAETLGFNAQGVKGSAEILDNLNSIPLPAIIHWMGYHWVVLYGRKGGKYVIADPAIGIRYLSRKELTEGWQNYIMLILEPDQVRFSLSQDNHKVDNLGQIFQRIKPYWAILAEVLLLNIFLGLTNLAYPFLLQILSDDVLVRRDLNLLNGLVIAVTVTSLLNGGLWLAQSTLTAHFAQRLELSLILEFIRKVLCLPLTYYETHRSGEIISRLRDIQRIRNIISQILVSFPGELFIAIASLVFLFFYSWKLMLITALSASIMLLSTIVFLPSLLQQTRRILAEEGENQAILIETFKGSLTLKTTSAVSQLWEQLQFRSSRLANMTFRTIQINITNRTFSRIISNLGSVGLLWFGSKLVIVQEITIGQLVAAYTLSQNVILLVVDSVILINELIWIKNAAARLIEVTSTNSEISIENLTKPFIKISGNADILCSHLNFNYSGQVSLLEDFSIFIPGGQVVALIGESGCGKSTLAKLIAGLYPLQSGNIRFGIYNLN
ncbi:MAG: peptidase domain-containing ABC transporter, partial [Microcystis aeruginosa]